MRAYALLLLLLTLPVWAVPQPGFLERASEAEVIFLGESHNSKADHEGQLAVLELLAETQEKPLVVVCEMFNELAEVDLEEILSQPELPRFQKFWEAQWGHPFELYHPIFRWAQQNGHTLAPLRPDPARARLVKKEGPQALLDPLGEFFLGPAAYRDHMRAIVADHMPDGTPPPEEMVDSFFLVQCFWDEYMSFRLAHLAQEYPGHTLVVLVGHGHLYNEFGIPLRLRRRAPQLKLLTVGFKENAEWNPDIVFALPLE